MLNCLYDCRYCFLQGMYSSANYVLFVNFEEFDADINSTIHRLKEEAVTFFSGYDCDSLALEKISGFAEQTIPFFKNYPKVDGIIHFAALKSVGESVKQPKKYYDNNLYSMLNIIEFMPKTIPFVFLAYSLLDKSLN